MTEVNGPSAIGVPSALLVRVRDLSGLLVRNTGAVPADGRRRADFGMIPQGARASTGCSLKPIARRARARALRTAEPGPGQSPRGTLAISICPSRATAPRANAGPGPQARHARRLHAHR